MRLSKIDIIKDYLKEIERQTVKRLEVFNRDNLMAEYYRKGITFTKSLLDSCLMGERDIPRFKRLVVT